MYEVNKGRQELKRGNHREARELFTMALEKDQRHSPAWYLLAYTFSSLEDRKRALRNAVQADNGHNMARNELQYLESLPDELSEGDRANLLQREIGRYLQSDWRVVEKGPTKARLIRRKEFSWASCCLFSLFYLVKRAGDEAPTMFLEVTADGRIEAY